MEKLGFDANTGELICSSRGSAWGPISPTGTIVWADRSECTPMPVTQDGHTLTVPATAHWEVSGPVWARGRAPHDGVLAFRLSEPGAYRVRLSLYPYLDHEAILYVD